MDIELFLLILSFGIVIAGAIISIWKDRYLPVIIGAAVASTTAVCIMSSFEKNMTNMSYHTESTITKLLLVDCSKINNDLYEVEYINEEGEQETTIVPENETTIMLQTNAFFAEEKTIVTTVRKNGPFYKKEKLSEGTKYTICVPHDHNFEVVH